MGKNIEKKEMKRIHFIGVGGISMSALAKHCLNKGLIVSGSDRQNSDMIKGLIDSGASIVVGHNERAVLEADIVCYTSAISEQDCELKLVREKGKTLIKRSQLLGEFANEYKRSIAVTGSHGKTTTTAIISKILLTAKLNPTVFLGGEDREYGNYRKGGKEYCVLEACEYKKNFLDIHPNISVVTNIDNDHLDSYSNIQEQIKATTLFVKDSIAIINIDDKNAQKVVSDKRVSVGIKNQGVVMAKNIVRKGEVTYFSLYVYGIKMGRIKTQIKGEYNIYNILCAVAVCIEIGVPFSAIKKGVESFQGVKRRDEYLGEYLGKKIYIDYAHHPKEISEYLSQERKGRNTLIIFQPHTYSRTKYLMEEFVKVFSSLDSKLIIYKTYPAREKYKRSGCAKVLYENISKGKQCMFCKSKAQIKEYIEKEKDIEKICFIGAGDVSEIARKLVEEGKIKKKNKKS